MRWTCPGETHAVAPALAMLTRNRIALSLVPVLWVAPRLAASDRVCAADGVATPADSLPPGLARSRRGDATRRVFPELVASCYYG